MVRPSRNILTYERRDGDEILRLVAHPDYGLPYGQDIVVLYGLCSRGRELYKYWGTEWNGVVSFRSTSAMLAYSGYPATKQYYDRYMDGLLRIYGTTMFVEKTLRGRRVGAVQMHLTRAELLKSITAWFQLEHRQLGMPFENVIVFSPEMREWICQAPAFEDQKIFLLTQVVGALQLYLLLRDRCAQLDLRDKEYTMIPIHGPMSIESQLGWVLLPDAREVRRRLRNWLDLIRTSVWPECPGEIHQGRDGYWRLKVWYVSPLSMRLAHFAECFPRLRTSFPSYNRPQGTSYNRPHPGLIWRRVGSYNRPRPSLLPVCNPVVSISYGAQRAVFLWITQRGPTQGQFGALRDRALRACFSGASPHTPKGKNSIEG